MSFGHRYETLPPYMTGGTYSYEDERASQQTLIGNGSQPWSNSNTGIYTGPGDNGRTSDQVGLSDLQRKPGSGPSVYVQPAPSASSTYVHAYPAGYQPGPSTAAATGQGKPLDRFLIRAVLSILIPLVLLAYYTLTYVRWLRHPEESGDAWVVQGYLDNAELVNYSWFVLATFGLNLGTYCISGSVASMTMAKWWSPANSKILLELAANSFADPSNWLKIIFAIIKKKSFHGQSNGRLWNMLTILNFIGFVAWPLTGLTMQTVDGFAIDLRGGPNGGNVLGRNETSFLQREGQALLDRETNGRTSGIVGQLPRGQLYTREGSTTPLNVTTRNMLPDDATTPIFLAPQADYPFVSNRVFGLLISYNCTVVNSSSEFTILNRRQNVSEFEGVNLQRNGVFYPAEEDNIYGPTIITLLRVNRTGLAQGDFNATMEVGTSIPWTNLTQSTIYQHGSYSNLDQIPGINKPVLLEAALWQGVPPDRIRGYYGYRNVSIRGVEKNELEDLRDAYPGQVAVGCRCFASSDVGFADLDGITASYSNFTSTVPRPRSGNQGASFVSPLRFEHGVLNRALSSKFWTLSAITLSRVFQNGIPPLFSDWYYNLLSSTGFFWRELRSLDEGDEYLGSVIQAEDLKSILLRMHHSYALQLMYDGTVDTSLSWSNPNITLSRPAKVLVPGVVPPEVILGMLAAWALGIVALSMVYQFRRRWTEKLNTFNMFILGLNMGGDVNITPEDLVRGSKRNLEDLPGTIGDLNVDGEVGVIGLTRGRGTVARRNKAY
ncbi:hypothetical protein TWF718_009860 [Orbilia javanica]|uniref:Transmembrane protein n=1 Tax=Orbilia javanica TaxID=47235 RepID=A0AAN8RG42_9PEZI